MVVPTAIARNSLIVLEGSASDIQILELRSNFLERHATKESDVQVNYLPKPIYPSDDGAVNMREVPAGNQLV